MFTSQDAVGPFYQVTAPMPCRALWAQPASSPGSSHLTGGRRAKGSWRASSTVTAGGQVCTLSCMWSEFKCFVHIWNLCSLCKRGYCIICWELRIRKGNWAFWGKSEGFDIAILESSCWAFERIARIYCGLLCAVSVRLGIRYLVVKSNWKIMLSVEVCLVPAVYSALWRTQFLHPRSL